MIAGESCVLIADDDPVSLRFLEEAVKQAGCAVLAAGGADSALQLVAAFPGEVDLLLLDRRMPGRDGCALLSALRACGVDAPAVATSAELDPALTQMLRDAGFAATLLKPTSIADVHALLHRFVEAAPSVQRDRASAPPPGLPLLDDPGALAAAGGDTGTLRALRELFSCELAAIDNPEVTAVGRPDLAERLHRLRASCGICGAPRLRAAVERLEAALRAGREGEAAMQDFVETCRATRQALLARDLREPAARIS